MKMEHISTSKRLVLVNALSQIVTRVLNLSVLVWLQQYLLKRISPEEYSLFPVIMSAIFFMPLLTSFMNVGLTRHVTEAYAKGDNDQVTTFVSSMFPFILGVGLLMMLLGIGFSWNVDQFLNIPDGRGDEATLMMLLLVVTLGVDFILFPFRIGFNLKQRFVILNIMRLGREFLRMLILLILLFSVSTSVVWVVLATAISTILSVLVEVWVSMRLVPALTFRLSMVRLREVIEPLTFGWWSLVSQAAQQIKRSSDPIILNLFSTPLEVTCFFVGSLVGNNLFSMIHLFLIPLQPQLIALYVSGNQQKLRNAYYRINKYMMWATVLAVAPLIIFRNEVVVLYIGAEYIKAATVLMLLLLPLPLYVANVMLMRIAPAINQVRATTSRELLSECLNMGLTIYLVAALHMGAFGSALATCLVGIITQLVLFIPLSVRMLDIDVKQWLAQTFLPGLMPGLVASVVWVVLERYYSPQTWMSLAVCALGGVVVYCVFLFFFGLKAFERLELINGCRMLLARFRS
jgi:O-antigen/teichoic acid export membrane protein